MAAFIQVEAVNLGDTVFDTDQLSVVRGGSLLIKAAIDAVQERFTSRMVALSTGASSGLFHTHEDPAGLVESIRDYLVEDEQYGLFTFLIESCKHENLQHAKAVLSARLRFAQLRSPNRVPDVLPDGKTQACGLEGRRVATGGNTVGDTTVSDSVFSRWRHGRVQRSRLYADQVPGDAANAPLRNFLKTLVFTDDINQLAECEAFPKLNNKVAVLYLDGNGFGKIQAATVRNAKDQRAFDKAVQDYRRAFLLKLLAEMMPEANAPGFVETVTAKDELRLETLMWGGDESLIVIPAWLGFAVLNLFFEISRDWQFKGHDLTHAVGLVFCHAKTPIFRMRELAQQVAEHVKEQGGRAENGFDYVVLESVDFPTEGRYVDYLHTRYGKTLVLYRCVARPFRNWPDAEKTLNTMLRDGGLARGQVYSIARALTLAATDASLNDEYCAPPWSADFKPVGRPPSAFELAEQRLFQVAENKHLAEQISTLAASWGVDLNMPAQRAWLWLHLLELWDYLLPVRKGEGKQI